MPIIDKYPKSRIHNGKQQVSFMLTDYVMKQLMNVPLNSFINIKESEHGAHGWLMDWNDKSCRPGSSVNEMQGQPNTNDY